MAHRTKFWQLLPMLLCILAVGGLLVGAQPASAQTCIQDVWKAHGNSQNLQCTANDVRIASAGNIRNPDGTARTTCIAGETFNFIADFTVQLTADTRYDIGLYFATDGDPNADGAITGTCSANVIRPFDSTTGLGSPNFIQLDRSPDTCGDIDSTHNPQIVTVQVNNVLCVDSDGDGNLNLPNCTTWRQPGSNDVCQTANDAFPGSPSKCNCDKAFNLPIRVETGSIKVTKAASPLSLPEPGGQFTYTVGVTNTSLVVSVTLDRICDDKFGEIVKVDGALACPAGTLGTIASTTCVVPQTLAPSGTYSCTFTATLISSTPTTVTDTVTVFGHDSNTPPNALQGSASAQVAISDVPPAAQVIKSLDSLQCAIVRYGVRVNNTSSAESLTLTALLDNTYGSITTVHDAVVATTCTVPQTIAASGSYTCTFDARFCGGSHTDKVTGTLNDNENATISPESNSLTVNVNATVGP